MNAFAKGRLVEASAMEVLKPWLQEHASNGQLVVTDKGTLAPLLQSIAGDMAYNRQEDGRLYTVELKAEAEQRASGNLFLETWSNKNLECRDSHAERGSNPGWMVKQRADLLFYYFIDTDNLYILNFFNLKRWAFGCGCTKGRIYDFPEVAQSKYTQLNDTFGRLVPLHVLSREVGFKLFHPRREQGQGRAAA